MAHIWHFPLVIMVKIRFKLAKFLTSEKLYCQKNWVVSCGKSQSECSHYIRILDHYCFFLLLIYLFHIIFLDIIIIMSFRSLQSCVKKYFHIYILWWTYCIVKKSAVFLVADSRANVLTTWSKYETIIGFFYCNN